MAQIKGTGVSVGYEKKIVADNINFEINEGDYLYIVGENGSGKSTLMKCILGLEKVVAGNIVYGDNLKQKEIGYLPQQTFIQRDFPATVQEIVLSGCLNQLGFRPFFGKKEKQRAEEAMKKLEITDLAKRSYPELSGGQQQRVLLARALCATGKVLLLDEPVAGLDPYAQEQLYTLIYKINKEEKITIIMVSHDLEAAKKYATHILHIGKEKSVFCTKHEFLKENGGCLF
ncbi:MAG: metal ABC transporter ATP-binding protein [Lachnospiraceae bacterium]|nr:metal ABC transporter ATP-binding protein [Lachnospiraceae bacterium]